MPPSESSPPGRFSIAAVSGLYSGYSPVAPGTMGSIVALLFLLIPGFSVPWILGPIIVITFLAGVFISTKFSTETTPDPSFVVIDEVAGMWISVIFLPHTLLSLAAAFLAFRILDIIKPFPCRRLERLPGGWGIMMDDVAAGVYANLVTRVIIEIV